MTAFFLHKARVVLRTHRIQCFVVCISVWAGCRAEPSPSEAFDAVAIAAESGDTDAFLDGFTDTSRAMLEGVFAIAGRNSRHFVLGAFSGRARATDFSEQSDGVALVLVQSTDSPPEVAQIVMRKETGRWRIDLVSTELLWNRSWELSGRSRRGEGMAMEIDPLDRPEVQR